MNLVERVTDLLNEVSSVIDDESFERGVNPVVSIRIADEGIQVHMGHEQYLKAFKPNHYDVTFENLEADFPYIFKSEIDGVLFICLMDEERILTLRNEKPEHFSYIMDLIPL